MSKIAVLFVPVVAMMAGGCSVKSDQARRDAVPVRSLMGPEPPAWRGIASDADQARIDRLDQAWSQALAEVRAAGASAAVLREGVLLDPKAGLDVATPTPGPYLCRTIKLGFRRSAAAAPVRAVRHRRGRRIRASAPRAYAVFAPFACYLTTEKDHIAFTKAGGSDRPAGWLWVDAGQRLVFIGTTPQKNETAVLGYGEAGARNTVGVVERIGDFRWRLLLPWQPGEVKLVVIEFAPHPAGVPQISER